MQPHEIIYRPHVMDRDWAVNFGVPVKYPESMPSHFSMPMDTIVEVRQSINDSSVYYVKTVRGYKDYRWFECTPSHYYLIIGKSNGTLARVTTEKWTRDYTTFDSGHIWKVSLKNGKRTLIARFTESSFSPVWRG